MGGGNCLSARIRALAIKGASAGLVWKAIASVGGLAALDRCPRVL